MQKKKALMCFTCMRTKNRVTMWRKIRSLMPNLLYVIFFKRFYKNLTNLQFYKVYPLISAPFINAYVYVNDVWDSPWVSSSFLFFVQQISLLPVTLWPMCNSSFSAQTHFTQQATVLEKSSIHLFLSPSQ